LGGSYAGKLKVEVKASKEWSCLPTNSREGEVIGHVFTSRDHLDEELA
jgi:hypothetical protein